MYPNFSPLPLTDLPVPLLSRPYLEAEGQRSWIIQTVEVGQPPGAKGVTESSLGAGQMTQGQSS